MLACVLPYICPKKPTLANFPKTLCIARKVAPALRDGTFVLCAHLSKIANLVHFLPMAWHSSSSRERARPCMRFRIIIYQVNLQLAKSVKCSIRKVPSTWALKFSCSQRVLLKVWGALYKIA